MIIYQLLNGFDLKLIEARSTPNNSNNKAVKIAVPLKNLNNFWRILEMIPINNKINLIKLWYTICVISVATRAKAFAFTVKKQTLHSYDNIMILDNTQAISTTKNRI